MPALQPPDDLDPAERAILETHERLGIKPPGDEAEDEAAFEAWARESSELAKAGWIRLRLVIGTAEFGAAWGRSRQSLGRACARGELFSLKIGTKRWYPAAFLSLPPADVADVCRVMRGLDPVTQFIFWTRKHGALGGCSLSEGLAQGEKKWVLRLAQVYAEENL